MTGTPFFDKYMWDGVSKKSNVLSPLYILDLLSVCDCDVIAAAESNYVTTELLFPGTQDRGREKIRKAKILGPWT